MVIKDIMRDKIKFTYIHSYKELAFIFILFLTDAFFFYACCIYVYML